MTDHEHPVTVKTEFNGTGCVLGLAGGFLLTVTQTLFQMQFTTTSGDKVKDQFIIIIFFMVQFSVAGFLAGSKYIGPPGNSLRGLVLGSLLGALGWIICLATQGVLWLFSFYLAWAVFGIGASILRASMISGRMTTHIGLGLLATIVSWAPLTTALVTWVEPGLNPSSSATIFLMWLASYGLALAIVLCRAPVGMDATIKPGG